jgi:hypothetical protein
MSNPTTPFSWQMPTNTDLVTDLPADFEVFGQAVATSMQDLLGGTTGQVLAKASNADMDFVWSADAAGMTNPMTTTGDSIYSSSGSTPARLGIGSAGQVLTVASGLPSWATPTAAGMTLITETTASALASLSYSSIPGTYKDLYLEWSGIFHSNNSTQFKMRFNNNSSTNYYGQIWQWSGALQPVWELVDYSSTTASYWAAFGNAVNLASSSAPPLNCTGRLKISNYASTTKKKTYEFSNYFYDNANARYNGQLATIMFYDSTSAISSIDIIRTAGTGTFSNTSDTSIRLYGIS